MNRLKQIAVALLLIASAVRAHAAVPSVVFDLDYNWQIGFSSFTSVTSQTVPLNPFIPSGQGYAIGGSTPNVIGYDFSFLPVGSSGTFTISQTTTTFSPEANSSAGFNDSGHPTNLYRSNLLVPIISTSTPVTVLPGTTMRDAYTEVFRAKTENPVFNFSGLSTAATYYLYWTYGVQRR